MLDACEALVEDAASLVEPHDEEEVAAFANELCALGGLTLQEMREKTAGTTVPGDFRHLRLTNLNRNWPWGGICNSRQLPLDLDEVLCVISIHAQRDDATNTGRGVWTETVALPVRDPGV